MSIGSSDEAYKFLAAEYQILITAFGWPLVWRAYLIHSTRTMGSNSETTTPADLDVLIIGAGLSGRYACHRMQQLNLKVKVVEAAPSVGGTWYWYVYSII